MLNDIIAIAVGNEIKWRLNNNFKNVIFVDNTPIGQNALNHAASVQILAQNIHLIFQLVEKQILQRFDHFKVKYQNKTKTKNSLILNVSRKYNRMFTLMYASPCLKYFCRT